MLHIVATPIGNLGDLTPRAKDVLTSADLIACEDTRRTWALLSAFHIARPEMISYREGREAAAGARVLKALQSGRDVALCSDGGYPGISDPGYRLIQLAIENGIDYDILPGASAVNLALLYSGLPTSSFTFKGFPPRKEGALRKFFEEERAMPHTLVIYESPFRVWHTLNAALEVLGDRRAAVCIEMTKQYERIHRDWLSGLAEFFKDRKVKGEVAIAIAGDNPKFAREAGMASAEPAH
ncbi:MAG: 16S rRNA (cytidine(1402)-2'-O)-methyltransferase [Kiritimatiellae bacterium]|nr:16S rRNA (cytidine(1402)-2'-O)-methyltransferase [Kiritimatiellia bacterium]